MSICALNPRLESEALPTHLGALWALSGFSIQRVLG